MIDTRPDIPEGFTHNRRGQVLTYKARAGWWYKRTVDNQGRELTFENSIGNWHEIFYDLNVKVENMKVFKI